MGVGRQAESPHGMLNCVGWCLIRLGRRDEGRARCDKAPALCEEHGHRHGIAHTLRSLGELGLVTGRYREAVGRLRIASGLFALLRHGFAQAGVLARLGEGAHDLARSSWERAVGCTGHSTAGPTIRVLGQLAWLG
ncbi:hypothetical protein [Streptomyces sp. NPDC088847]|uniref:hypothetical protein n=1 Tax=Streptomyces sp. NPDC088847 TaxID=3365909 RepID=UPI00382D25B1